MSFVALSFIHHLLSLCSRKQINLFRSDLEVLGSSTQTRHNIPMSFPQAHRPVSRPRATYPTSASTSSSTFNFESSSSTGSQPTFDNLPHSSTSNLTHSYVFPAVDEHYGESHERYSTRQPSQTIPYTRPVPSTSRQDNEVYITPPRVQPSLQVDPTLVGVSPRPSHRRRSPSSSPSLPRAVFTRHDDNWAGFVDSIANQSNFGGEFRNQLQGFTTVCMRVTHLVFRRTVIF